MLSMASAPIAWGLGALPNSCPNAVGSTGKGWEAVGSYRATEAVSFRGVRSKNRVPSKGYPIREARVRLPAPPLFSDSFSSVKTDGWKTEPRL